MRRPKGPIDCWTDRQLRHAQYRIGIALSQLREATGDTCDVYIGMPHGWRPRKGQCTVEPFYGIRGELLQTVRTSPHYRTVCVRFDRMRIRLLLELKLAAVCDQRNIRAGRPRVLDAPILEYTPEQAAWMVRTRAINEAADVHSM